MSDSVTAGRDGKHDPGALLGSYRPAYHNAIARDVFGPVLDVLLKLSQSKKEAKDGLGGSLSRPE